MLQQKERLKQVIGHNAITLIKGETGSGKSSEVPDIMLELLPGNAKMLCTQPRIVAATTLAKYKAQCWHSTLPGHVGYHAEGEEVTTHWTTLTYATNGAVVQKLLSDPLLKRYQGICIDEVHEESPCLDMLIRQVLAIVEKRPEFKVVLMSADPENCFKYFQQSPPLVSILGREHPVEISENTIESDDFKALQQHLIKLVRQELKWSQPGAAILVFVPDVHWISSLLQGIGEEDRSTSTYPLHSKLTQGEIDAAFKTQQGVRKVVVSTNIAESSLTLEDVTVVIDSGLHRVVHVEPDTGYELSDIVAISKVSAKQRAGRAGRKQAGRCVRAYKFEDLVDINLPATSFYTLPHVLNAVALTQAWKSLHGEIKNVQSMLQRLAKEECVTDAHQLSPKGQTIAAMPYDKLEDRLALYECLHTDLFPAMVVMLAIMQDNRGLQRKTDDPETLNFRKHLTHASSDFLTALSVFNAYMSDETFVRRFGLNIKVMDKAVQLVRRMGVPVQQHHLDTEQEARVLQILRDTYPHAYLTKDKYHLLVKDADGNDWKQLGMVFGQCKSHSEITYRTAIFVHGDSSLPCRVLTGVTSVVHCSEASEPPHKVSKFSHRSDAAADASTVDAATKRVVVDMQGWVPSTEEIRVATESAARKTAFEVPAPREPVVIGCSTNKNVYFFCQAPECKSWCAQCSSAGFELAANVNCPHVDQTASVTPFLCSTPAHPSVPATAAASSWATPVAPSAPGSAATQFPIVQILASMKTPNEWRTYLEAHSTDTVSKRTLRDMPAFCGSPGLEETGAAIVAEARGEAQLEFESSEVTRNGEGVLMTWLMKNAQSLASGEGWLAWHGTPLPYLSSILRGARLQPGPADSTGVFCFKNENKYMAWFYSPAFCAHTAGIWAKVLIRVDAAGKWAGEPPKTEKKTQWLTSEAIVTGVTIELFGAHALQLGEGIIDVRDLMTPPPLQVALPPVSQHEPMAVDEPVAAGQEKRTHGNITDGIVAERHDVIGEQELRDFLKQSGYGARKAYYFSCLQDYKGPRACNKLSKFLKQCKSIEMYVEDDGREAIRLAPNFGSEDSFFEMD